MQKEFNSYEVLVGDTIVHSHVTRRFAESFVETWRIIHGDGEAKIRKLPADGS